MAIQHVSDAAAGAGWIGGTSLLASALYVGGTVTSGVLSLVAYATSEDVHISTQAANGMISTLVLAALGYLGKLTVEWFADRKSVRENNARLLRFEYEARIAAIELENVAAKTRRETEREFTNGQMLVLRERINQLNDALAHTTNDIQVTGGAVETNAHAIEHLAEQTGVGPVATGKIPPDLGQLPPDFAVIP